MNVGQHLGERIRTSISILLIGSVGLLATGCSLGKSSNNNQPTTIPVRIWRLNQDKDPTRDPINTYLADHPQIRPTYTKKSLDGYELAALDSLASGNGPDVWSIPNDWLGDEENRTVALPNAFYKETGDPGTDPAAAATTLFPTGIVEQIVRQPDRAVYGVPTNVDSLRMYLNSDLYIAAINDFRTSLGKNYSDATFLPVQQLLNHTPTTWDELARQCKYVSVRTGTGFSRSCAALGTADNLPAANDVLQLLMMQNGVDVVSSDHTRALFGDQQRTEAGRIIRPGQQALEFFTSFSDPSKENYSWSPSQPQALDAFGQGKVAIVFAYKDFEKELKVKYPQAPYLVRAVPQVSTTQTPVNMIKFMTETVTKNAANSSAAFHIIKAYTVLNASKSLASEQGLYTPYLTVLNAQAADDPIAKQILTGRAVFKKNRDQFDAAFRQMIINVSQNHGDPSTSLDVGVQKINSLLSPLASPTP